MARTRDLKPGFFKNERLAECEPLARILWEGLWVHADREGRLEDRPLKLRVEILPYDVCDIENLLVQLAAQGFIVRYEVNGKRYIAIPGFKENQRIHPKEPASLIPPPAEESCDLSRQNVESHDKTETDRTIPSLPSSPSLPPYPPEGHVADATVCGSLFDGLPQAEKNKIAIPSSAKGTTVSPGFVRFWEAYPKSVRKVEKSRCFRKWKDRKLEFLTDAILASLETHKQSDQWRRDNGQFIPSPSVFINQSRWEAEIGNPEQASSQNQAASNKHIDQLMAAKHIRNVWERNVFLETSQLRRDSFNQLWLGDEMLTLSDYEPVENDRDV